MKPKYVLITCLVALLAGQAIAQEASGEEVDEEFSVTDEVQPVEPAEELAVEVEPTVADDAVEVIGEQTDTSETEGVEPTKAAPGTTISRSGKYLSFDDYNFNYNEHQEVGEFDNNYNYGEFFGDL